MGKYDYPPEDLRQTNRGLYMSQKVRAQGYNEQLREFESMARHHVEQAKYHREESKKYMKLYNELKKENE